VNQTILFVLIGIVSGGLFSLIGTGAGLLIIPGLVFLAHFSQKMAVGTSITLLLPPIGVFAALEYWKHGNVNWRSGNSNWTKNANFSIEKGPEINLSGPWLTE
jgi:uncharacterized membrane protein YfcA